MSKFVLSDCDVSGESGSDDDSGRGENSFENEVVVEGIAQSDLNFYRRSLVSRDPRLCLPHGDGSVERSEHASVVEEFPAREFSVGRGDRSLDKIDPEFGDDGESFSSVTGRLQDSLRRYNESIRCVSSCGRGSRTKRGASSLHATSGGGKGKNRIESERGGSDESSFVVGGLAAEEASTSTAVSGGRSDVQSGERVANFRCNAKKIFLTCSHLSKEIFDKETAKELSLRLFQSFECDYLVCAKELKYNGAEVTDLSLCTNEDLFNRHVHVFFAFKTKVNIRNCNYFDHLFDKHCNFSSARSVSAVIGYLLKDPSADIAAAGECDLEQLMAGVTGKFDQCVGLLRNGVPMYVVARRFPGQFARNLEKLKAYADWIMRNTEVNEIRSYNLPKRVSIVYKSALSGVYVVDVKLSRFAMGVLKVANLIREGGMSKVTEYDIWKEHGNLLLYGAPGVGKTNICRLLRSIFVCWEVNVDSSHNDNYDHLSEFAQFDDFYGQRKLSWILKVLDTGVFTLSARYSDRVRFYWKPCVFTSNAPLTEWYDSVFEKMRLSHPEAANNLAGALRRRFLNIVEVESRDYMMQVELHDGAIITQGVNADWSKVLRGANGGLI